uniref:probable G-protein coupled receptor 160 n=1 Tax=Solea senegalensis TaxID=28829 RepID=UPI001CD83E42|nr:probable G-protein coupled receptor 160 [Solea senegalensis]
MLPGLPLFPDTSHAVKMLAIIEQWDERSGCQADKSEKYLLLIVVKLGMDAAVFYLCCRKISTSFFYMCSLSMVLADLVMAVCMSALWFLGAEKSSVCYFLAHISATFAALPLPMMCFGLLDYCTEDTCLGIKRVICKFLRNVVLTVLVWMLAVLYSFASTNAELMLLVYKTGVKASVCEVQESMLVTYFVLGLFIIIIFTMLPFCSSIPRWVTEVDRLSELREEQENHRSDLFTSTPSTETKSIKDNYLEDTIKPRPPLWFSLTLGFSTFWMPYLTMSVVCLAFGFGVPAYINVNLLLLECTNSLLMGLVFWVKSKSFGPYSHVPENVCLWHVYWHLSKGTWQQHLPTAVFNPSKEKRLSLFYV